ncbi:histonelysine Nmethyltransferase SETMARlike [Trichonephila clavipes]|nr:histonelysine Nmethyltransferase SETMARlike [Trichonephila clavipes]
MATYRNDTLKHHLSNLPTENSEVCQVYNKDFNPRSNLNSRLRIHIQKNPHVCKICNKVFSRSDSLKILLRIHTEEKIHVCVVCNKAFSQSVENASQAAEIVKGLYGADTVTANYVQFWFNRFRSGIFYVKDAPRTFRTVVEIVDKITDIIEVDRHVSIRSIAQELKIDHKTVLNHLHKVGFKKMLDRGEAAEAVAKPGLMARKVLLCIWWDWKGIIYYEFFPFVQELNSDLYCQQLDRLKLVID